MTKKQTTIEHPSTTDFKIIQSEINQAVAAKKAKLEAEGYNVPSFSVSLKDHSSTTFQPKIPFTKLYEEFLYTIDAKHGLSTIEKGIIMTLIKNIGYENNLLCHPDGTALNKKDLCDVLGLAHNAVDKHMKTLVEKGIFAKVQVKRSVNFYLNPYVAYRGSRIDNTLLSMFKTTKI